MPTTLISNALIINEGTRTTGDILIAEGRIAAIGPNLSDRPADKVIDAKGKVLMPGMIDCHVHCRDPGLSEKGDLHTETRAAVAGGVTSIMEMPNTRPAAVTHEVLEQKFKIAAQKCLTNYSFYIGASNSNMDELLATNPRKVCGVKLFMGASTGNLLVDRAATLQRIFSEIKIPVALHCEDTNIIRENEKRLREQYPDGIPFRYHPVIRSEKACYESTKLAVDLATRYGTQIHVLHVTTAKELELFESTPLENKKITAEACPHHLWFSDTDYDEKGALIKCNPAIKTAADRTALREGLINGKIDTLGTDHAPHLWGEKQNLYGSAPSGMPVIQSVLTSALEYLTPEQVAEKAAHNPARIYQVEKRGFIREGYWADLVLIDLNAPHTVSKENIAYKCGWSPFEGVTFKASIAATWVNGELAFDNGKIQDEVRGQRLTFDR